jgi:transcriptional regulator with XRE-family HTH domain
MCIWYKYKTQADLAFECEMEISQVSRMERGILNTSISNMYLIAKALKVHHKELFDFEIKKRK